MVEAEEGAFMIRKQTFIVKNNRSVDEVYIREKKVGEIFGSIVIFLRIFRKLEVVRMVRSVLPFTEKTVRKELSK